MAAAGCDGSPDRVNVRTDRRRAGNVMMVNGPRGRLCIGRASLLSRFQAKNERTADSLESRDGGLA